MPHIQVELDALNLAPGVARYVGFSEDTAIAGLNRMWAHCYRHKTDRVTGGLLVGFFGGDRERLIAALVGHEFIEPDEVDGAFRVRGAKRYWRIHAARSKGGHAAKSNLIPGARQKMAAEKDSRDPAEPTSRLNPSVGSRLPSALDPKSEIREIDKKLPRAREPSPSPGEPTLREKCEEVFLDVRGFAYAWGDGDLHVRDLQRMTPDDDEIPRRFSRALRRRYPTCNSLRELKREDVWNAAATEEEPKPGFPPKAVERIPPVPAGNPCEVCAAPAPSKFFERWLCYPCGSAALSDGVSFANAADWVRNRKAGAA